MAGRVLASDMEECGPGQADLTAANPLAGGAVRRYGIRDAYEVDQDPLVVGPLTAAD